MPTLRRRVTLAQSLPVLLLLGWLLLPGTVAPAAAQSVPHERAPDGTLGSPRREAPRQALRPGSGPDWQADRSPLRDGASGPVPLPVAPTWVATEADLFGTGLAVDDLDGDGWLDLAVSNGNDMAAAVNLVYHNDGGVLPPAATWTSADARYSGHCALGDLDGDGHPELVVGNYISAGWGTAPVQVYPNQGGQLAVSPGWESAPAVNAFRVALGDPDGDGDLDLAVATGEAYHGVLQPNLVFFNEGGELAATPGWSSDMADASYDIAFVDHDGDGDQDLACLGGGWEGRVTIYENQDGVLATSPAWSTSATDNGNTFDFDDLDGDGRLDLAIGYNTQLGGSGRFAVHLTAGGDLPTTPTWTSEFQGYGSAVICADVDGTGGPDLIAGGWWQPLRIYRNDGSGGFAATADWQSDATWSSVAEAIALADLDAGAVRTEVVSFDAGSRLLRLPDRHLQAIVSVAVADAPLPRTHWCASREDGWVSLDAPATGPVTVTYRVSAARDLILSNWDDGTYVFANQTPTAAPTHTVPRAVVQDLAAWPNPFNPATTIGFRLTRDVSRAHLAAYDLRGRRVAVLHAGPLAAGSHRLAWRPRDLPSGAYVYRLQVDGGASTASGTVVLVR
jgi:hypothetical protein